MIYVKVLLYTEGLKAIGISGLGKAVQHQMRALEEQQIDYTCDLHVKEYDLVHINFYGPKSYHLAKKARRQGKKVVYHAHSTMEDFRNSFLLSNQLAPLFKWWICKCYNLGDSIITPTLYSKKLLKGYGIQKPIYAISNGIDTPFFERDEALGKEFRATYGFTENQKVIVGIGLYIERKGILDFVELAKRLPQYQFIWFGSSPLAASPLKIRQAVTSKLPNLQFPGHVESKMIHAALSGCDLFLMPTQEETEGIPVMEAAIAKAPTIIRDIPIFEAWLEDGISTYKAKDIDEFEKKTKLILEGKLKPVVEETYKIAKQKDMEVVGKQLITAYEETLAETQNPEKWGL